MAEPKLGFVIEDGILREEGGGCHQATWTELAMWNALQQARVLALEEAARECESEAQDFSPDWGRQAIASAHLCAIRVRARIGKEPS